MNLQVMFQQNKFQRRTIKISCLLAGLLLYQSLGWGKELRLDDFSQTFPPNQAYGKWDVRKFKPFFRSGEQQLFQFVHKENVHHIHIKSGKNNFFSLGFKHLFSMQAWPMLEWEWKVTQFPTSGDIRKPEKNDQAGSVCVSVNPGLSAQSICYLWEVETPKQKWIFLESGLTKTHYLVLRNQKSDGITKWYSEKRNILADYEQRFGKIDKQQAIVNFMIDSDTTASQAEVFYRKIKLISP